MRASAGARAAGARHVQAHIPFKANFRISPYIRAAKHIKTYIIEELAKSRQFLKICAQRGEIEV